LRYYVFVSATLSSNHMDHPSLGHLGHPVKLTGQGALIGRGRGGGGGEGVLHGFQAAAKEPRANAGVQQGRQGDVHQPHLEKAEGSERALGESQCPTKTTECKRA